MQKETNWKEFDEKFEESTAYKAGSPAAIKTKEYFQSMLDQKDREIEAAREEGKMQVLTNDGAFVAMIAKKANTILLALIRKEVEGMKLTEMTKGIEHVNVYIDTYGEKQSYNAALLDVAKLLDFHKQ